MDLPIATKSWVAVLLVIFAALPIASCGKSADEQFQRAKGFFEAGDVNSALVDLKSVLKKAPEHAGARRMLGNVYLEIGDGAGAEKELRRAAELEPSSAQELLLPLSRAAMMRGAFETVLSLAAGEEGLSVDPALLAPTERAEFSALRGHAFMALRRTDEAAEAYGEALAADGENREATLGSARLALAGGNVDEALRKLEMLVKREPDFAPAWSILGELYRQENRLDAAERAFSSAAEHRRNNSGDILSRATVRVQQGNLDSALSDIEQLRKGGLRHPGIPYIEGLVAFQRKQYAEAKNAFSSALKLNSNYLPAAFHLGATHYQLGNLGQADENLLRYLNAYPESAEAARLLAAVRLRNGDFAGAETVLQPVLERNPDDTLSMTLLSQAVLPQGRADEAVGYLQEVADQEAQSATARTRLGLGLLAAGKQAEGVEELEKAAGLETRGHSAATALVRAHLQQKEYDKALAAAQKLAAELPESPEPLYFQGLAYLGMLDQAKAREAFEKARALWAGHRGASLYLARIELAAGNRVRARELYNDVLANNPRDLLTTIALATLDNAEGQGEAAVDRLEAAMRDHPRALAPKLLLAQYYLRARQATRALTILREGQQHHPENPQLLLQLGNTQLAMGQPAAALSAFEKLAEIRPNAGEPYYRIAMAKAAMEDQDGMKESLSKALELEPSHLMGTISRIRLLLLSGELEKAAEALQELKKRHPDHPETYALEGALALRENRVEEAKEVYQAALDRFPSSRWVVALVRVNRFAGETDAALELMDKWLAEHEDDALVRYTLADVLLQQGKNEAAKAAFERVVELWPQNVAALNNLAWLLKDSDPSRALVYAEQAHEMAPASGQVMDTLAVILLSQGEADRALDLLRNASQAAPEEPSIRLHLAQALESNGENDEAREVLRPLIVSEQAFGGRDAAVALWKRLGGE